VSSLAVDLRSTSGFLVADVRGKLLGRVESPMYGTRPDEPDALAVRKRFLGKRHLVPAEAIETVDGASGVIGLRVEREAIKKFL
jgi:hypothetical protein